MYQKLQLAIFLSSLAVFAAAQSPLPIKMEGAWKNTDTGHAGGVQVELVRMESSTEAVIKVAWLPYCPLAETKARFSEGIWKFVPQGCSADINVSARLRPVEGKNRLEGTYGSRSGRTVFLEW